MGMQSLFSESVFDWYQGTFDDSVVLESLVEKLRSHYEFSSVEMVNPQVRQYSRGLNLVRGDSVLVHLCYGGCNGENIHFKATGYAGQLFFEFLRVHHISGYAVSRADVRLDSYESGIFDYLDRVSTQFAISHNISTNTVGDWKTGKAGRTLYLGSKTSKAQIRIYEKGKQLGANPDWARIEIQVRPPKRRDKLRAGGLQPGDFWTAALWSRRLMNKIMIDKNSFKGDSMKGVWSSTNQQERTKHLVTQYGNTLESIAESLPFGWNDLGAFLQLFIEARDSCGGAKGGIDTENPYEKVMQKLITQVR